MATEYYDASESSAHDDIDTLHADRDCHHLDGADYVFGINDADEDINRCGTCCDIPDDNDEESGGDGSGDEGDGEDSGE